MPFLYRHQHPGSHKGSTSRFEVSIPMAARVKKFTQSEEVTLAQTVEKHPTLWDCTLECYRRTDLKPNLWSQVAEVVGTGFTGDDVSKRFKNMKETFTANNRKVRESEKKCSGSATEDVYTPTWFLYKYLLYLVKTCAQAPSQSNLPPPAEESTHFKSNEPVHTSIHTHYFDVTMQQWYPIPQEEGEAALQKLLSQPDQSNLLDESEAASDVSFPSSSTCKRPASSSSPCAAPSKVAASEEYFFNKKGSTKKSNSSLLQSAVQAMEKIASETCVLPAMPQAQNAQNDFANFIANRLAALDLSPRKQCENEILQVVLKY